MRIRPRGHAHCSDQQLTIGASLHDISIRLCMWWMLMAKLTQNRVPSTPELEITGPVLLGMSAGVAIQHSRAMLHSSAVMVHVVDAVDTIVGTLGSVPPTLEAMLLQPEAHPLPELLLFAVTLSCPKVRCCCPPKVQASRVRPAHGCVVILAILRPARSPGCCCLLSPAPAPGCGAVHLGLQDQAL